MKQLFCSDTLYQTLSTLTFSKKIFIAFSGGLDSKVLLHALKQIQLVHPEFELTAIHVNHSINAAAKDWEKHCQDLCGNLKIPLISKVVDATIKINDHSPEEIARLLRYQVFADILPQDGVLVTAHQADDQAETLLLQLFRGAGPKGLAAMQSKVPFAKSWLIRPLLSFSRKALEDYANKNKLSWIEDLSNLDTKYNRNFLRHKILPKLREKWPGITTTLNRVATHCAEAEQLLEVLAAQDIALCVGGVKNTLSAMQIRKLDFARQRNLLRYWLHQQKLAIPSTAKLEQILHCVVLSNLSAQPVVTWHGGEVRRYRDDIYAMMPLQPIDHALIIPWDLSQPLILPNSLGILHAEIDVETISNCCKKFYIRFRKGGENIRLHGHSHLLKKLFQEWDVLPWQRERLPLIYCADELVAVANYCIADTATGIRKIVYQQTS